MCCRGGLAGRVATQNAIHALRNRGMIEIDGAAARGAAQRLRATPKLAGRMREELSVRLQAMSPVIPWPAPAAEFALAPDVVRTFLAGNIVAYREFDFVLYSGFPEVKSFMDRRHGYVVLLHVLSRTEAAGRFALATTPPSEIAMRFDVSRAHVRKLFAAAAARGWLNCARGGRIDFDAGVYDRLRLWIALEFAWTRWLLLESA
jgi:hypothetical protein